MSKSDNNKVLFSAVGMGVLIFAGIVGLYAQLTPTASPHNASVMIVAPNGRSGGTGVILSSSKTESRILTNSHVCRLVEKGGFVEATSGTYTVVSYKHNPNHDLCIVSVNSDLKTNTRIATRAPRAFSETASISGHPALLPNVITTGHFSGNRIVPVMTGVKKCSEKDLDGPYGFLCAMFGIKPIIKLYDATLVTATIMPGSSGSAVYNSDGELSNLAFAGSGQIGYAWTVPYDAVIAFLSTEKDLPATNVGVLDLDAASESVEEENKRKLKNVRNTCTDVVKAEKLGEICKILSRDMIWRQ